MLDGAMMFVYFDLCLYVLHRLMHTTWLYEAAHRRHHDHTNVSGISLYVMNPLEAAGFGLLLILFLLGHSCSIEALLGFLFLNWLYGTIGHSALPISGGLLSWFVGDAAFHHRHNVEQNCNFGFFTGVWDRLWRTLAEALKSSWHCPGSGVSRGFWGGPGHYRSRLDRGLLERVGKGCV
ncbi:MAG: sterol desaturase family protein [Bryobacteraceae bacterium]|nr:sterol desaturase family protein [Bryobacteraceae bacterium]